VVARSFGRPDRSLAVRNAQPAIESLFARGLSGNAIQRELSSLGLGVRRIELQAVLRDMRGASLAADRLKFVRHDRLPDPSRLAPAVWHQLRELSFKVRVQGYSPVTGEQESRYFNVSSDSLLTRGDIEGIALGYSVDDETYTPFEPQQVDLVSATTKP
jgi:hypothetical protein